MDEIGWICFDDGMDRRGWFVVWYGWWDGT
jgi:hypothetical protein